MKTYENCENVEELWEYIDLLHKHAVGFLKDIGFQDRIINEYMEDIAWLTLTPIQEIKRQLKEEPETRRPLLRLLKGENENH